MIGTLCSRTGGATSVSDWLGGWGRGVVGWGSAVACLRILAIWMYALEMGEPYVREGSGCVEVP
jgi:hypothetical protein